MKKAIIHEQKNKCIIQKTTKSKKLGNSLAVQLLGLGGFTAMAWVQSLVGEVPHATQCGQKIKMKKSLIKLKKSVL